VVELKDKLLRAVAEIQNVQRRAEKERADAVKYGIAEFAKDILGIHDNLHRALESCGECSDSIADGIRLTILEMDRTLSRRGVVRIDSVGRKFDPHIHQALTEIEDPEVEPGTIVCVMQDGFMIHDRLLRPALVGVSRLPSGV
jgi:molecular chaperone GrpE